MDFPWSRERSYGRFIDPQPFSSDSPWRNPIRLLQNLGEFPQFAWTKIEKQEKPVYWLPDSIEELEQFTPSVLGLPITDEGLALLYLSVVLNGQADPLPSDIVSSIIRAEVGEIEPFRGILGSSFWWLKSTKDHPNLAYLYTTE